MERRRQRADVVLLVTGVAALLALAYFGARFGDVYRIGDSLHRRDTGYDRLTVAGPLLVAITSFVGSTFRRMTGGSLATQWKRERALLAEARSFPPPD
jgi:hypothetical protein